MPGRAITAIAGVALAALVLTGCANSDPHPAPLARAQKIALYERSTDGAWNDFRRLDSSLARPDLRVRTVSSGSQWVLDTAGCLRNHGVKEFSASSTGVVTISGEAGGLNTGSELIFICRAEHPRTSDLDGFLSSAQIGALYDYYVNWLQPCLVSRGIPSVKAPTRKSFTADYYVAGWSPYNVVRYFRGATGISPDERFVTLNRECPPEPFWLPKS
jgi:hypothetical protein